jgi:hypothetical protein
MTKIFAESSAPVCRRFLTHFSRAGLQGVQKTPACLLNEKTFAVEGAGTEACATMQFLFHAEKTFGKRYN